MLQVTYRHTLVFGTRQKQKPWKRKSSLNVRCLLSRHLSSFFLYWDILIYFWKISFIYIDIKITSLVNHPYPISFDFIKIGCFLRNTFCFILKELQQKLWSVLLKETMYVKMYDGVLWKPTSTSSQLDSLIQKINFLLRLHLYLRKALLVFTGCLVSSAVWPFNNRSSAGFYKQVVVRIFSVYFINLLNFFIIWVIAN